MWKLFIADDEPKIRRGLKKCLPWDEYDIEIVGEAEDGEIALELAKKLTPDILFVDICMPFLNGLDLIRELNTCLPQSIIIIISGYNEFRYAQEAVKLNVLDYVLKPVKETQLESVIKKSVEILSKDQQTKAYTKWAQAQFQQNYANLVNTFFNQWISGSYSFSQVEEQLSYLHLQLERDSGLFIIQPLTTISIGKSFPQLEPDLLLFCTQNIIQELLQDWTPNVVFQDQNKNLVLITPVHQHAQWIELSAKFEAIIEEYLGIGILVVQRTLKDGLASLPSVYSSLSEDLKKKNSYTPIVLLAKRYIDKYYYKPDLSLTEVSNYVQSSPTYLSRLLKRELGCSFVDYLAKVRIKKSIQFMRDPSMKIYEVAEQVGYNTQHYFSTAFKKITGVSPITYKNKTRRDL